MPSHELTKARRFKKWEDFASQKEIDYDQIGSTFPFRGRSGLDLNQRVR